MDQLIGVIDSYGYWPMVRQVFSHGVFRPAMGQPADRPEVERGLAGLDRLRAGISFGLTGPEGKPFVGSTVLAVYDKAVEYIAGGSNVADIKEFFWKWRRTHRG